MSIWGKVIGSVAGYALGGPLGGLIGAVAGHAVDRMRGGTGDGVGTRQIAFTIAVIALSAKMAKADGRVTRVEIDAFKRVFHIPPGELKSVGRLFDEARKDTTDFQPYAEQISEMFVGEPAVLEELLGGLFHIAWADGVIHPAELEYLRRVADVFGFDGPGFERIRASQMDPEKVDPYGVLGVPRDATAAEVKKTYRRLIRENHPDTLIAQGLPQEFVDLANEKMAHINAAYDSVEKERKLP